MYKIRKITFHNHPILGNLFLNFCNPEGKSVDTVILAGENGTGKSTILNAIYTLISQVADFEADVEYETNNTVFVMTYRYKDLKNGSRYLYANDGTGMNAILGSKDVSNKYPMTGIYSDVDINFHSEKLSSVTSLTLDEKSGSRRSSNDLPRQINQLLIDIQALDDADVAFAVREHPELAGKDLGVEERMPRFTSAFNRMFDDNAFPVSKKLLSQL